MPETFVIEFAHVVPSKEHLIWNLLLHSRHHSVIQAHTWTCDIVEKSLLGIHPRKAKIVLGFTAIASLALSVLRDGNRREVRRVMYHRESLHQKQHMWGVQIFSRALSTSCLHAVAVPNVNRKLNYICTFFVLC